MTEVAVEISQAMDNAVNDAVGSYRDLINEAFISPIRSAVVVDDEFPTLDGFLVDREAAAIKPYAGRALDIINFCRNRLPYPWIVDIHDGRNISFDGEALTATHFDHTDLLVLDYHLNGNEGGAERALSLLRKLSSNEHFNLVIVYTNNDISETLKQIALALSCDSVFSSFFSNVSHKYLARVILKWEETHGDVLSELTESIDRLTLVKAVTKGEYWLKQFERLDEFRVFCDVLTLAPDGLRFNGVDMLKYVLGEKFKLLKEQMSVVNFGLVETGELNAPDGRVVNWVRVDSLFVTVVNKTDVAPDQFADCLVTAIEAWDPSPHRLILSRMRGEVSRRGIMVEQEVLKNPYLQAAWLSDIFKRENSELRTNVRRNVSRHWESLGSKVEPGVLRFAEKVGQYLADNDVEVSKYCETYIMSNTEKIALHVNNYVCSKPVEGHHLSTGHVFSLGKDEYWICLTPACDLEPREDVSGGNKHLGTWKPFKAAQIVPMPDCIPALKNATRGNHLFLSIGETEPVAFTFLPNAGSEHSETPTLRWQQFYARDQGKFDNQSNFFNVARSLVTEKGLAFEEQVALVIAHVRYEYALHLLHRLGSHLSRVGLDFVKPVEAEG